MSTGETKGELKRVIDWEGRREFWVDAECRKQGEYKGFHKNGAIAVKLNYVDGVVCGDAYQYNDKGDLILHEYYVDGVRMPGTVFQKGVREITTAGELREMLEEEKEEEVINVNDKGTIVARKTQKVVDTYDIEIGEDIWNWMLEETKRKGNVCTSSSGISLRAKPTYGNTASGDFKKPKFSLNDEDVLGYKKEPRKLFRELNDLKRAFDGRKKDEKDYQGDVIMF